VGKTDNPKAKVNEIMDGEWKMQSTNGHGPERVVLYARVSTEEQARSGYSLAQQMEALRAYAAREGYEVLKEASDPGQSGASLERPGMDRVRELVAAGGVSVVLAQDWDRFSREPAYHWLLETEFEEHGCELRALNDDGDKSPEGVLMRGMKSQLAKYERLKIAERSRRGVLEKVREGKVVATHRARYGFCFNANKDGYELDPEKMSVVREIFRMAGVERRPLYAVRKGLEEAGIPTPTGRRHWSQTYIRNVILDDVYRPIPTVRLRRWSHRRSRTGLTPRGATVFFGSTARR
jgi:site-specific DNA recombinase